MKNRFDAKFLAPILAVVILLTTLLSVGIVVGATTGTGDYTLATVGTVTGGLNTWRESPKVSYEHTGSKLNLEVTMAPATAADAPNVAGYIVKFGVGVNPVQITLFGTSITCGSDPAKALNTDLTVSHTMRIEVDGTACSVFVDGAFAASTTLAAAYNGGTFTFHSRSNNVAAANTVFTNLKISSTLSATTTTTAGSTTTTGSPTQDPGTGDYTLATVGTVTGGLNTWRESPKVSYEHTGSKLNLEVTMAPATAADAPNVAGYIVKFGVGVNPVQITLFGTSITCGSDPAKALNTDLTVSHTMRIEVDGTACSVFVDGAFAASTTLATAYSGGTFTFHSRSNNVAAANTVFTSLKISSTLPAATTTTAGSTTTTTTDGSTTTTTTGSPTQDPETVIDGTGLEEVVINLPNAGSSNSEGRYRLVGTDPLSCAGSMFILEYDFAPISKSTNEALDAFLLEYGITSTGTKWQAMVWANNVTVNYGTETIANAPVATDLTVSHKLKLMVNDKSVTVYLDGNKVLTKTTEASFTGGAFQFYGRNGNVTVSNLKLTTYRKKETLPDGERYLVEVKELSNINNWRNMSNSTYVEKISPIKLDADNFTFEYKITTTAGDKVNTFNFGIQDLNNRIMGPIGFFRMTPELVEYWERPENSSSGDVRLGSTTNLPANYDGTEFTVKVVVDKTKATLFINGTQVMEVTMSRAYTGGGFDLSDRKTTSTYSDIKVSYYTDELPEGSLIPTKPEVGNDMVWVENEALSQIDDWEFVGSAESTYREYLSPVNVNQSNFVLDMDIEYLAGDGKQYYIDFGLQNATEADRGKGPYYSFVFNQGTVFLYYRADDVDELEKSWVVPSGVVGDDPFHVRLYVDGKYAALYLGDGDEPVLEHTLKHAYTGGGFNLKTRNTFAFFNDLSIQSYMDKASASTKTTTTTKTTAAGDSETNSNPDTGFKFPVVIVMTAMLAFAVAMMAATKRLVSKK